MAFDAVPRVAHAVRPMQVRFFEEPDITALENAINAWLAEDARREIVDIRQSVVTTGGDRRSFVVSIWYVPD